MDFEKYLKPNMEKARKRDKNKITTVNYTLKEEERLLGKGKFFHIKTFGCQGNEADSEAMSGILKEMSFFATDNENEADLILLNTCAIRENAENRIWGELGRLKLLKRHNPNLIIGLCGCMPQEEATINRLLKNYHHIDLIFGTHNIYKLPEYIKMAYFNQEKVIEVFSTQGQIVEQMPKHRANKYKAFVNIMFGCDEFCTYCIVPYTRGKERSREKHYILEEVKKLVSEGYHEVTLLGQNVNAYGKDFQDINYTFSDLLADLDATGIKRIRFTTSHPRDLDEKTIKAMATLSSVMPHIHLPVQSGDNLILKKMNRKYRVEDYLDLVSKLKKEIPGISITTDIIVGFPSESDDQFENTLKLVHNVQFEGAFTFIYSARENTPAASYSDDITIEVKNKRLQTLIELVNHYYLLGNKRFLGENVEVLVDRKTAEDMYSGYSAHNKLVNFKGQDHLLGQIIKVKIIEAKTWFLIGEVLS